VRQRARVDLQNIVGVCGDGLDTNTCAASGSHPKLAVIVRVSRVKHFFGKRRAVLDNSNVHPRVRPETA